MRIAVALKWVPLRFSVDPLSGAVSVDAHDWGASPADLAGLEWALRLAEEWNGSVTAATVGPPGAEAMLRDALAAGAAGAVRVDPAGSLTSAAVASALAGLAPLAEADVILCGDASLDRGSGAVPAYLAAARGGAQALGLVALAPEAPGVVRAQRRLDGGWREELRVAAPAVLSVEGSTARLRRAPLAGVLQAREVEIPVVAPGEAGTAPPSRWGPYRPRARIIPAPSGDDVRQRILAVTGTLVDRPANELVTLPPAAAADRFLEQLRAWGYLE
jgi:electron transfer flavoprotein beta subunit